MTNQQTATCKTRSIDASNDNCVPSVIATHRIAPAAAAAADGMLFPFKLHKLLDAVSDCGDSPAIAWLQDGKSFRIYNRSRFANEIMPIYFATTRFRSFQKNLNLWGFTTPSRNSFNGGRGRWVLYTIRTEELERKLVFWASTIPTDVTNMNLHLLLETLAVSGDIHSSNVVLMIFVIKWDDVSSEGEEQGKKKINASLIQALLQPYVVLLLEVRFLLVFRAPSPPQPMLALWPLQLNWRLCYPIAEDFNDKISPPRENSWATVASLEPISKHRLLCRLQHLGYWGSDISPVFNLIQQQPLFISCCSIHRAIETSLETRTQFRVVVWIPLAHLHHLRRRRHCHLLNKQWQFRLQSMPLRLKACLGNHKISRNL